MGEVGAGEVDGFDGGVEGGLEEEGEGDVAHGADVVVVGWVLGRGV